MATKTPLSIPMDVDFSDKDLKPQNNPEPLSVSGNIPTITTTQGQLATNSCVTSTQSLISLFLKATPTSNTPQLVLQATPTSNTPQLVLQAMPTSNTPQLVLQATPTPQAKTTPTPAKPKLTREEREAQRIERERAKAEILARREEERIRRDQEKARKEAEKKERQERKVREEQERRWRRERKDAEKKRREEERKKAELEREQAKEEKLRKEQQKKERFMGFFSRQPKVDSSKKAVKQVYSFITPFSVQADMTLAPKPRPPPPSTSLFDQLLVTQDPAISLEDSLKELKKNAPPKIKDQPKPLEKDIIEVKPAESKIRRRFKLLQFHQNYRPAYYGTWQKTSGSINPRNPFRKDESQLDYGGDSDDEWEEEEPGESISNSEGEDSCEEGGDNEEEEDDGFFVPHGYLSDEEGGDDMPAGFDPTGCSTDDDNEIKRSKMAAKARAWEAEFARKCQPLKPVCVGCSWTRLSGEGGDNLSKDVGFLEQFAAVALVDLPLMVEAKKETKEPTENLGGNAEVTRMPVPEEAVPDLIRLIHGNAIGVARIIKTFRMHWGSKRVATPTSTPTNSVTSPKTPSATLPQDSSYLENASKISKRQLEKKIHEIAVKKCLSPSNNKPVWCVHESVLKKYNVDPDNIVPFLSPMTSSEPVKMTTPTTPYSACDKKRPHTGTRTLFEILKKSPNNKRIKLQLHVDKSPSSDNDPPQKRSLEDPTTPQSAAKRLCLEDTTNKTGEEGNLPINNNVLSLSVL